MSLIFNSRFEVVTATLYVIRCLRQRVIYILILSLLGLGRTQDCLFYDLKGIPLGFEPCWGKNQCLHHCRVCAHCNHSKFAQQVLVGRRDGSIEEVTLHYSSDKICFTRLLELFLGIFNGYVISLFSPFLGCSHYFCYIFTIK